MKLATHDLNNVQFCLTYYLRGPIQRVPELSPFSNSVYPYRESLCLKLVPQFSSHLNDIFNVCLISFDNVVIGGILVTVITDSSSCSCFQMTNLTISEKVSRFHFYYKRRTSD